MKDYKSGFIAIEGVPNAGKSTLLNYLLGEKIAIVTPKPQTTRHKILGVVTGAGYQLVFWDTPGLHESSRLLNQEMNAKALSALADCDLVLWVIDAKKENQDFAKAAEVITASKKPLIIALNKVDLLEDKSICSQLIDKLDARFQPLKVLPISAKNGFGVEELKKELIHYVPFGPAHYPEDTLTDQSERDIVAEMVREAVFKLTSQEIPYSSAVTIDEFLVPSDTCEVYKISATIHVERYSQKGVIIGHGGKMLKSIGIAARQRIEAFLEGKVFLRLFVRITRDWSKSKKELTDLGYS